ncbi:MAG: ECF transporter S component [Anaerolineae bacterium]|nr:ECF transporter S component [Anaerolineae bacterium]
MFRNWSASRLVVAGVLTAVVAVLTLMVRVPIAPTRGYIHLGDAGVYFAAFAFGPAIGFVAGGLGTGLADVLGGYAHWAPLSFLFHGFQGLVAGYLALRGGRGGHLLGWLVGSIIMIGGYFLAEVILYGLGPAATEVPGNLSQAIAGGLIGLPLAAAIRRAWPPVQRLATPTTWRER